jgi:BlaI family transcriptional regulator, penicillinase repressor
MPQFTAGELEVMSILWEAGELKPAEIQARFPRPIKDPALRSYLAILLKKGHVARRKEGKAYYYKARAKREGARKGQLREMVEKFYRGSREALLVHLIKMERLSEAELLELKKIADGEAPGGGDGKNKAGGKR